MQVQFTRGYAPLRIKTGFLVSLGLTAVLAGVAIALTHDPSRSRGRSDTDRPLSPTHVESPAFLSYLRLEQWRADARTAVAVLRYLFEPETDLDPTRTKPPELR